SYGEGVATYHMSASRRHLGRPSPPSYIDCTAAVGAGNLNFSFEIEGPNIAAIGAASEVTVAAVLWDILDSPSSDDLYPGDDDPLSRSIAELWEVMDVYIPTAVNISLEDFWDGWFAPAVNNGFLTEMREVFGALTCEFFPDAHESDGTAATASIVPVDGTPQLHNFYASGDTDFARFTSPAIGSPFILETGSLFGDANTTLSIIDQNGTSVLVTNDNRNAFDESSLLQWTAPAAGNYYARLMHAPDLGVYGSYSLRVIQGTPSGIVWTDVANVAGVGSSRPGRGGAWGDFNGDGHPDLYVTNAAGNAWELFQNNGAGGFTDVSVLAGVTGNGSTGEQAVWGDYDNDGDADLAVAVIGVNMLYRNNGNNTFTNVAAAAGVNHAGAGSLGASWCDYDGDGWLDLFVGTIDANDILYRNNGNGTFTDVAGAAGVGGAGEDTFGGVWADYDLDTDPDLFVHYDGSPNRLFRNGGDGTFTDVTPAILMESGVRSWGASWTDIDHDGDFDLYVSCLGSPCRLYRNDSGTFVERGAAAGVDPAGSQTGHVAFDFDNDNDEDLYVGAFDEPNLYFDNLTGTAFYNSGKAADNLQARSVTSADYDSDGDADLHVVLSNGNNLLYSNNGTARPWIRLRLTGVISNRSAIGARVTLKSGGRRYVQQITGGTGYISQNESRLLFPLGTLAGPDTFDVRWPSGAFQRVTGLARNQTHTILEVDQTAVPVVDAIRPAILALAQNHPNPFQSSTTIRFALPRAERVTLVILDVQGRLVRTLLAEDVPAGVWEEAWDGRGADGGPAASSIYFYRLTAGDQVVTRRLLLAR
ncbi:MAG: FG-GAP-like repeat-containing protein, partial [Candidatus Eisenbacteria bacterium]|nr:FG-GAP-like repeat-containing protein [Candidatus Eisenbacteria bacterium]